MTKQLVKIQCKGAAEVDIDELIPFQGDLKILTEENYFKLRDEILEDGFSEPISVWKKMMKGKKAVCLYILNGHQRHAALKRMREDGWKIPKLPVSFVEASDEKSAKRKVLALTSQYGTMTTDGLTNFMKEAGLKITALDKFSFPEINLPEFRLQFEPPKADEEEKKGKNVSFEAYQNAAIKQIVLYFQQTDYQAIIDVFDSLMETWEMEDYSQVVWRLASETTTTTKPRNK